jgi:hypothetical protein
MKRFLPCLLAVAALAAPAVASANGVVLKVDRASHLAAVTRGGTSVALVHTAARLHVGQRVALQARTLRNGTLAATSVRVTGRTKHVRFRGLLLARDRGHMVVSAAGAVISLDKRAADAAPKPGAQVEVEAQVEDDEGLEVEDVDVVTPTAPGGRIEGRLTLGTGQITVSSEHMSLVLKVPAGLDLSAFRNGDEVLATFSQQADGSLVLTKLARDDDNEDEHEDGDDDHGGDHHGGGGGGGDD